MVAEEDTGSDGSASIGDVDIDEPEVPIIPHPQALRWSMDEFFQHDPPPPYDDFLPASIFRRKFIIQPREDEGREILPEYSTSISLQNVFYRKLEWENATRRSEDRNWNRVMVTLQGTLLSLHKVSATAFFSGSSGQKHNADFPIGTKIGGPIKNYNLQYAEVGIAADYQKKSFVIRVRAETDQFLLSCHKIETFILWLQSLLAAIGIAAPLDEREQPRDLSIPRSRHRSRRYVVPTPVAARSRDGSPIPQPGARPASPRSSTSSVSSPLPTIPTPILSSLRIRPQPLLLAIPRPSPHHDSIPHPFASRTSSTPSTQPPRLPTRPTPIPLKKKEVRNPSLTSDGKWRPYHHWTHIYDMLYAKRCLSTLTARSPRKSNLVISDGKCYVVDWITGVMRPVGELPGYEEVDPRARELEAGSEGSTAASIGSSLSTTVSTEEGMESAQITPSVRTPEDIGMEIRTLELLPLMSLPGKEIDLQIQVQQVEMVGV